MKTASQHEPRSFPDPDAWIKTINREWQFRPRHKYIEWGVNQRSTKFWGWGSWHTVLGALDDGALDDGALQLRREAVEVGRVAANADDQVGVAIGVLQGVL